MSDSFARETSVRLGISNNQSVVVKSLSNMIELTFLNEVLSSSCIVSFISVVSLGKSSQSILIHFTTSHYQCV